MSVRILIGDARDKLRELPDASVHCCVTSPPYFGLRDYGCEGQMGLEATPAEFVEGMVGLFREVRRALRNDGTLWLNLGDSYGGGGDTFIRGSAARPAADPGATKAGMTAAAIKAAGLGKSNTGLPAKNLLGIPWRVAFALQADGWWLRQDIIWSKPNPMPESVQDRCTKAHEYLFLLSKEPRYHYDAAAIREESSDPEGSAARYKSSFGGAKNEHLLASDQVHTRPIGMREFDGNRNKRSVWEVATQPFSGAHFATFPPALIEPCILAGCPTGGTVLDPFGGAGTTGLVADRLGRDAVLIELNPEYAALAEKRIRGDGGMFAQVQAA